MPFYIDIDSGVGLATPKPIPLPKTPIISPTAPGIKPTTYGPQPATQPTPQQQAVLLVQPYKTSGDSFDLVKIMQAAVNNPELKQAAEIIFEPADIHIAEYAAKPALDSEQWAKLSPERQKYLRPVADATESEYAKMTDWQKLGVKNVTPDKPPPQSIAQKVKGGAIIAAEVLIPGVYAGRHWSQMSGAEKGLILAIDAICLLPMTGAAVRGARAAYPQTSSLARLAGATKAVGKEAISFVRAPVDLIVHPIQTVKGVGTGVKYQARNIESLLENVVHPSKIPEAVITTSQGTVRIPVSKVSDANKVRNQIMVLAKRNERIFVEIGNARVEVVRSPLMKEAGGGLAHATPQGTAWEYGGKVAVKPGLSTAEQGLFFSHEPLPRFTLSTAYGKVGEKPAIIIISKETAESAVSSGKIYRGTAELESKLPVGTVIFEPKQRLFTRVGPMQERVEIWLEKPLTRVQIAKLKAQALVESVKTLAQPPIKISKLNKGLTDDEARALSKILGESDSELAGRVLRTGRIVSRGRTAPPSLARLIGRVGARGRVSESALRRAEAELRRGVARASDRVPAREAVRRTEREVAREKAREPVREPVREPTREAERVLGREPVREPIREERISDIPRTPRPPREERIPDEPRPPKRGKKKSDDFELEIERVEGIPRNPGIVSWNKGIVNIEIVPPYREGSEDIHFELLKKPQKGKGSQETTLKVKGGQAPKLVVLGRQGGIAKTHIIKGKRMVHTRQRGPGILTSSGKFRRVRRGSVI